MRVGFGCTVYARGLANQHLDGIAYYTNELALRLSSSVDMAPFVFGQTTITELYGKQVIQLPRFNPGALTSAITGLQFPGANQFKGRVDLVHASDHFIPRLNGIPVVATLMDAIPLSNPEWANSKLRSLKNVLWKKTASWADHIVTISEYSKREIANHFNIDPQKISVVPLGVDERFFQTLTPADVKQSLAALNLPDQYFLFIGTLQPRKNLERLIAAHQSLPAAIRTAFPLVMVGRAGWGCQDLVSQIQAMPKSEPVHWVGSVNDTSKRALLQQATALVFVSLSEGFGLPVLEAFASSTPVIASNTTALPEVTENAALLVDPLRTDEIAGAMLQIADNAALAAQLKSQGLNRARNFTWQACAEKTHEIYKKLGA